MADQLPNSHYYNLLGGVNYKASRYEMSTTEFLDLRNVDFDKPNALQIRPGSSLYTGSPFSGPVIAQVEYDKFFSNPFVPTSWLMANAGGGVFINAFSAAINPTNFSQISSGWGVSQPVDFVISADRSWMANGTQWRYFDGLYDLPAGLLQTTSALSQHLPYSAQSYGGNGVGVTYYTVFGITCSVASALPFQTVDFMVAYSYVRYDGYEGPMNVFYLARNMMSAGNSAQVGVVPLTNAVEVMTPQTAGGFGGFVISGFTTPPNRGISWIALYLDLHTSNGTRSTNFGNGYVPGVAAGGTTLLPSAGVNFKFFTLIPALTTFFTLTTNEISSWSAFLATNPRGQSGITWDFFNTNTPRYLEVDSNGTMYSAGYTNNPSTFYYSDLGTPEIINPANGIEFRSNDGDRIYAVKEYANQIMIYKERSFARLIGTDVDSYQLIPLSTDYGCISNRTVLTKDQICYWLDKKGIVEYNGANWSIVSDKVESIFKRMNIPAAKELAVGVHHVYRNQLWWGIPIDGSTVNNMTVVFDYLVGKWTFFDGFNPSSFAFMKATFGKETVWRGDYSGNIHFFGESFFNDSGQGITCLGLTRFENDGGENQTTLWRRFFIDTAIASGITGQINIQAFINYNLSQVQATFSTYQDQFQYRTEFGVQGKAIAIEFSRFSASLPFLMHGYGYAKRGLRNV